MTLPNTVTYIGEAVFYNDEALSEITIIDNGGNSENLKTMLINNAIMDASNITWIM